jgi:hypothetical protein
MGIRDLFNAPAGSSIKGRNLVVAEAKVETIFSKSYIERKAREAEEAKQKEEDEKEAKRAANAAKKANASQIVAGLPVGQVMVNVGKGKGKAKEGKEGKVEPRRSPIEVKTFFANSNVPRIDHFDKLSEARKYASQAVSHLKFREETDVDESGEIVVKLVHDGYKTPDAQSVDLTWQESEPVMSDPRNGVQTFLGRYTGDFHRSASYTATEFRRSFQDKCNKDERYADARLHNLVAITNDPKPIKIEIPPSPAFEQELTDLDGLRVKVELGDRDVEKRPGFEDKLRASVVRNLNKAKGTEITRNTTRPSVAQWQQRARSDKSTFSRG